MADDTQDQVAPATGFHTPDLSTPAPDTAPGPVYTADDPLLHQSSLGKTLDTWTGWDVNTPESRPLGFTPNMVKGFRDAGVFQPEHDADPGVKGEIQSFAEGILRPAAAGIDYAAQRVPRVAWEDLKGAFEQVKTDLAAAGWKRDESLWKNVSNSMEQGAGLTFGLMGFPTTPGTLSAVPADIAQLGLSPVSIPFDIAVSRPFGAVVEKETGIPRAKAQAALTLALAALPIAKGIRSFSATELGPDTVSVAREQKTIGPEHDPLPEAATAAEHANNAIEPATLAIHPDDAPTFKPAETPTPEPAQEFKGGAGTVEEAHDAVTGQAFSAMAHEVNGIFESTARPGSFSRMAEQIDDTHTVPYGGGISNDGRTVYIDKNLPETINVRRADGTTAPMDFRKYVAIHEPTEQAAMEEGGKTYEEAHVESANAAEREIVEKDGWDWADYQRQLLSEIEKLSEHEHATDVPADLYQKPYIESGQGNLVERHGNGTPPGAMEGREAGAVPAPGVATGEALSRSTVASGGGRAISAEAAKSPRLVLNPPDPSAVVRMDHDTGINTDEKAGNIRAIRLEALQSNPDAIQAIYDSAERNAGHMDARIGLMPMSHLQALADAFGVTDIGRLDIGRLSALLPNANMVRSAYEAFIQSAQDVSAAASKLALKGGVDDDVELASLKQLLLQHDILQEQVAYGNSQFGKTGNVIQSFLTRVRETKDLTEALKGTGPVDTPDKLRTLAGQIRNSSGRRETARILDATRSETWWDRVMQVYANNLLGPVTHVAMTLSNAMFATYDAAVITPIAGAIDAAKVALGKQDARSAFASEGAARLWGLAAGSGDGFIAAMKALKSGIPTLRPDQEAALARAEQRGIGEAPTNESLPETGINTITGLPTGSQWGGTAGQILRLPSRMSAFVHTLANFMGYRSGIEAAAYRQALIEGHKPFTESFWERKAQLTENPSQDMTNGADKNANRLSFTAPVGPGIRGLQQFLRATKVGQLLLPFTRVPTNLFKASLEGTPMAAMDATMRENLTGQNGAAAQATQQARMVAGIGVSAMALTMFMNGRITDGGPLDRDARARWLRTHEPYSIRIGDHWVSYEKFGPIGDLLGLGANLGRVGQYMGRGQYERVAGQFVKGAVNWISSGAGMFGLFNATQAAQDPVRYGERYIRNFATNLLPLSNTLGQVASLTDPYMRDVKSTLDAFEAKIPGFRQQLPAALDWLGRPKDNPRFRLGGIEPNTRLEPTAVDLAVQRLHITPAPPEARIRGVQLDPKQYHEYQLLAGPVTENSLSRLVSRGNWATLEPRVQETLVRHTIQAARATAQKTMLMRHHDLLLQSIKNKTAPILPLEPDE